VRSVEVGKKGSTLQILGIATAAKKGLAVDWLSDREPTYHPAGRGADTAYIPPQPARRESG